jgi:hypothetical protein
MRVINSKTICTELVSIEIEQTMQDGRPVNNPRMFLRLVALYRQVPDKCALSLDNLYALQDAVEKAISIYHIDFCEMLQQKQLG